MGQWERALTQLKVTSELDPVALPMGQAYRELVLCELFRREVFAGRQTPLLFGEPAEWMALLVRALQLGAQEMPRTRGACANGRSNRRQPPPEPSTDGASVGLPSGPAAGDRS